MWLSQICTEVAKGQHNLPRDSRVGIKEVRLAGDMWLNKELDNSNLYSWDTRWKPKDPLFWGGGRNSRNGTMNKITNNQHTRQRVPRMKVSVTWPTRRMQKHRTSHLLVKGWSQGGRGRLWKPSEGTKHISYCRSEVTGWAQWRRPAVLADGRLRQGDCKIKACLGYSVSSRSVWVGPYSKQKIR